MRAREPFETGVSEVEGAEKDIVDVWEDFEDNEVTSFEADMAGELEEVEDCDIDETVAVMVGESEPTVTDDDEDKDELVTEGNGKVDVAAARGELKDPVIPSRLNYSEINSNINIWVQMHTWKMSKMLPQGQCH